MSDTPRTDAIEERYRERKIYEGNLLDHARELERELAEARRASAEWQQNFETLCRAVVGNTGLSAIGEVRKLKRDAERLRWLKENASDIRWEGCHVVRATMHCLDVSIDAAMKEGEK